MSETDKSSTPPLGPPHPPTSDESEMSSQSHIAIYHSHSMSHVQQPQSSHPMPSTLYPSHPHWQYAQGAYPNQNTGVYYQPTNQVVHSGAIPAQYPTSYQGWSGPLPVQQDQVSPNQTQYFDPDSPVSNRESGPSRTKRQRRRSAQDPMGIVEGDTSDRPETPPSSSSKRTKPGSSASASVESKSFSCSLCSATFTRKGDCLRHTRSVHTRETPYDCQGCGELFTRSDMRGKHWKMDPQCEKAHWREVMTASGRANLLEPDA